MEEIWKDIKGYEGSYQVSNMGNVKSLPRWRNANSTGYIQKGKLLSKNLMNKGYYQLRLHNNGTINTFLCHRLVAMTFIPNPNNLPEVNHISGDKKNNHVENLEWVTSSQNKYHAYKIGLKFGKKGIDNGNGKLNDNDVINIRNLYSENKISQIELAKKYNVTQGFISYLINNKRRY